ncbi:ABC transporter ATP-binding protein [Marinomonas mediterranea]|jgi:oligopeptide/dipeptide ABC transporter, ATP-binding protein, C-terminal domain|uniref:ABC-type dipeptide transporter n=1 Tax=Marinomonas mediterranea (strain ATCC 700492 / JCM 21426 / NBRC 103028 / MMB-1) TaxID=717774 RepID=F2JZX5_MARM1|nr:ABC transporter ATP-binding protein [Marinomonas mediterranea]ADZ92087.1 oligopeptide/dipeptide ABC transporter, ATPase subunit [Marinomonas mediterranea MMB-1]WCN10049.1 ATP-binding cassette domain-containing protein [Marinomonas mediterranea]WCN14099.1 ATP-binding cassette domain-containing protein [Marinomonas mediterranea]WCN18155.1 ATP-binding cassette domain-containing protein [Marinomonas mediterranea MMB-1]
MSLLSVKDLNVSFRIGRQELPALIDISFSLERGERIAFVGESGAGKSILGFSMVNLITRPGFIKSGSIKLDKKEIIGLRPRHMQEVRGKRIAMIFQDPMMTLNPVLTIGQQLVEAIKSHTNITYREAKNIAIEKLASVQIASPEKRFDQYPHELSGGMRQRVIIAAILLLTPDIIIADEPTTALDVTIQAEILQLLLEICKKNGVALILISHDLGIVSKVAERTLVMYAGRIVEEGPTLELINDPQHPYTQGLLNALPQMSLPGQRLNQIKGSMPSLSDRPSGCAFHNRCPYATDKCKTQQPEFINSGISTVSCFLIEDMFEEERASLGEY